MKTLFFSQFLSVVCIAFLLAVLSFALALILRRMLIGPHIRWRRQKLEEWGALLDQVIGRMEEPTSEEITRLTFHGRFSRLVLEEVLFARMDLLRGKSRAPLAIIFEKTGLQKMAVAELSNRRTWVRRRAVDRLGRGANRQVSTHLLLALRDKDEDVRAIAAKSLGKLGIVSAAPFMVSIFTDLSEDRCTVVADTLIDLGESAIVPLSGALAHESEKTRYFAALSIANICDLHTCSIGAQSYHPLGRTATMQELIPESVPAEISRLVNDWSGRVRWAAIKALASLCVKQDDVVTRVEVLLEKDEDPSVRAAAAEALAVLGSTESADVLVDALTDPVWDVAYAASRALAALGAPNIERLDSPELKDSRAPIWRSEIMELAAELRF